MTDNTFNIEKLQDKPNQMIYRKGSLASAKPNFPQDQIYSHH